MSKYENWTCFNIKDNEDFLLIYDTLKSEWERITFSRGIWNVFEDIKNYVFCKDSYGEWWLMVVWGLLSRDHDFKKWYKFDF